MSLVIALSFYAGHIVLADDEVIIPTDVSGMITYYSNVYGNSSTELYNVAKCESNLRTNVYGDGGLAFGVMQFHKPTFYRWSKEMGVSLDYYSSNDQIKLASYVFSKGTAYKKHWTCFTKLY